MIQFNNEIISPDLLQKIKNLEVEIESFRQIPLDQIALEKLKEHFRTHHIYHSAGIEGNRLTLQETALVLKEGIDISGKPLKDSIEVKNLGLAYDFLYELAQQNVPISENYIKQIHKLIIGDDPALGPGEYRNIGVIITGSEHKPPEPFEVPIRMMELVEWIRENDNQNPIIVAAIAHHEFVKIHPFKDGNGRTARILLNLILFKKGFPICNIRREERPMYYDALSLADTGQYEPIIEIVAGNCSTLFSEYIRVKDESNRLKDWALKLGNKDYELRLAKVKTEFDLWQNKVNQIKLEFKQAVTILNETIHSYYISFYEYQPITLEKYQQLKDTGIAAGTNFFSIRFHDNDNDRIVATFMFRFFRSNNKYPFAPTAIPLELNYFNKEKDDFDFIGFFRHSKDITLRAFFIDDRGELVTRYINPEEANPNYEHESRDIRLTDTVMTFFQQVFEKVLGVR
ncbi:Fic family protein [Phnomibacter sp. MR]|uniref:Fic family protein n=1 Tax=Phnomibacter sp. MR TaxID=3042318 RepID=UPI003A7FC0F7